MGLELKLFWIYCNINLTFLKYLYAFFKLVFIQKWVFPCMSIFIGYLNEDTVQLVLFSYIAWFCKDYDSL